jgi:hypothetical protein
MGDYCIKAIFAIGKCAADRQVQDSFLSSHSRLFPILVMCLPCTCLNSMLIMRKMCKLSQLHLLFFLFHFNVFMGRGWEMTFFSLHKKKKYEC